MVFLGKLRPTPQEQCILVDLEHLGNVKFLQMAWANFALKRLV